MNKIILFGGASILIMTLGACGNIETPTLETIKETSVEETSTTKAEKETKKITKTKTKEKETKEEEEITSKELSIEELVEKTLNGDYGNGPDREKALGDKYSEVQQLIDERLAVSQSVNTEITNTEVETEPVTEVVIQETQEPQTHSDTSSMDVYQLGAELYGISELDTTRALILITYEGYGGSPLSYYVACCCWVRATEGYWGYGNLYRAFGEVDTSYDTWMDGLGIADYAYEALRQCYLNPTYARYCNGMTVPSSWIYAENGIYVW